MEEWERRYKHDKDRRDAQCISLGIPIPENEEHGTLKPIKGLWMRFNGKSFWKEFEARGHTRGVYEECECRLRN